MKNRRSEKSEVNEEERMKSSKSISMKRNKKNMSRLGGGRGGLSLQAFANAKSTSAQYNPALLKKQREFYKNAKYVSKFKKTLKQQGQQSNPSPAVKPVEVFF
ncbi:hypothetical protein Tsubulata_049609 [Turnera subulata]|uniref:Uncharacterized protein n=1 Tax=Turnera subulata TaxID=218843 RepID=A0A9Q0F337_9ROSI|nr:hypothetical protein Tsubulata_049609 [Turnera subulata]